MSRSNHDKPFYVDVGTSIVAIRCASNHDVIMEYNHVTDSYTLELAKKVCDRMNKEAEIGKPIRNCDIGTAKEQGERFAKYCYSKKDPIFVCLNCPLLGETGGHCELAWGQLPYEKGGAE